MVGLAILTAPAVVGSVLSEGDGLGPIAEAPPDNPGRGLVYAGLKPAQKGTPCVGAYEVAEPTMCSHGPDEPPPGLNVKRDVEPIARTSPAPTLPRRDTSPAPRERDLLADAGARAAGRGPALAPAALAAPDGDVELGPNGVVCDGDGTSGRRVQVLYVYEAGRASRFSQYLASFRTWAAGVDAIYDASAQTSGGTRHLRYVTTPDCQVDVQEVQVPAGALATFRANITALRELGFDRTDRKYMIFADTRVYCGIGTFAKDDVAGANNRNNRGPSYGRSDAGCWNASVAAHELAHTLGGVQDSAPNSNQAGHCVDDHDVMCAEGSARAAVRVECPDRANEQRLDCNHDDYFNANPRPGSYLADHWNVATSDYLIAGRDGASEPGPAPQPVPPPDPQESEPTANPTAAPEPTRPPEPDPTATGGPPPAGPEPTATADPQDPGSPDDPQAPAPEAPAGAPEPGAGADEGGQDGVGQDGVGQDRGGQASGGLAARAAAAQPGAQGAGQPGPGSARVTTDGADLVTTDLASTSVRISWPAAGSGARYAVVVDGRTLGTVAATQARVIGLRPDTAYDIQVTVRGGDGSGGAAGVRPYTGEVTVRTPAATRPTGARWFQLSNALTGGAATLYGARGAAGTPLVLGPADGAANQQWQVQPAGGGRFLLRSRATGGCVAPLGAAVPGAVVVQRPCAAQDAGQHWRIARAGHGFSLATAQGRLVVGVSRLRYGDQRLLVLQRPEAVRYQAWSAPPA